MKYLPFALIPLLFVASTAVAAPDRCKETFKNAVKGAWLKDELLITRIKQMGYKIRGYEYEHHCVEVDAWDREGRRVELYLDPIDGHIIEQKIKD